MDKRLEDLSDKVSRGIPIDFGEALEVLKYQETLSAEREEKKEQVSSRSANAVDSWGITLS